MQVQVLFPAPSALTIGAASELVRNDGFAFLYAKPGLMPPLSPVFRRNTRLGLHHWPGSFVNCSDQPRRDFNSRGFFRICRVPRVRRVIRVIRVIRVRIASGQYHHWPEAFFISPFPFNGLLHHSDQVAHLHAQCFGNPPQRLYIGVRVTGFDFSQVAAGYRREAG